jgi:hypothetical protein
MYNYLTKSIDFSRVVNTRAACDGCMVLVASAISTYEAFPEFKWFQNGLSRQKPVCEKNHFLAAKFF